jgi:hypothetical protein
MPPCFRNRHPHKDTRGMPSFISPLGYPEPAIFLGIIDSSGQIEGLGR